MNLDILADAEFFYQTKGFKKIDVPWTAGDEVINLTLPENKYGFYLNLEEFPIERLVGSAEQSFLQMIKDQKLKPGKYCATTPCFRDDIEDELHQLYFMKTELINFKIYDTKESIENRNKELKEIVDHGLEFLNGYVPCEIINIGGNNWDIIDSKHHIELGSYGIREWKHNNKIISWVYGTGVAVPRLPIVIAKNQNIGYHKEFIRKSKVGTIDKIVEEVKELQDAKLQGTDIMELVELSDIYGAIELYLKENHPTISMEDLKKMSEITQRAFENKRR